MNSRPRSRIVLFLCLVCLNAGFTAAAVAACASGKFDTTVLSIARAGSGPVEISVEIARTEQQRAQGLMHRKKLSDGEGMIFIFDRDQQMSFWMKNTVIPLSIAFIASDGRIVEIKDMQPLDLNSVKSSRSVRYALETPQGWFGRADVQAGDLVHGIP